MAAVVAALNRTMNITDSGETLAVAVEQLGDGVDNTLRLVSRILAGIALLVAVGICVALPILKKEFGPKVSPRPMRAHKLKQLLYNCCCCGFCCPAVPKKLGFNALESLTLRVTLISVSGLKSAMDFYFELWTEPLEGHPKMSRLHQQAVGDLSLHSEQVELDWFGDEEEVVIQCVEYAGTQVSKDQAVGQVRISREAVERYAREAKGNEADMSKGTRCYEVRKLSVMGARQRTLRFTGPSPMILPKILTKIQEESGFEVPDAELHKALKLENEALRRENQQLGGTLANMKSVADQPLPESLMTVAIRLELITPPTPGTADSYRSTSFEIQPEQTA